MELVSDMADADGACIGSDVLEFEGALAGVPEDRGLPEERLGSAAEAAARAGCGARPVPGGGFMEEAEVGGPGAGR